MHERFGYGYDSAGNLTTRTNAELVQSFGVNNLNELTTVSRTTSNMTVAGTVGSPGTNVTSVTVADNGHSAVAATVYQDKSFARANVGVVNGANTFTAVAQDAYGRSDTNTVTVKLPNSVSYSYDANGNLLSDGLRSFTYDQENQLTSVIVTNGVGNSTRTDLVYDGLMRMRIRREWNWQGGGWAELGETRYLYDGRRVVQERDGNNIPLVTYTRGPDLSGSLEGAGGIGGLLARTDHNNGTTAYYYIDANGNVTILINQQQAPVAKYAYDPFGNLLAKAGPLADANVYRFSSKEYHAASGLYSYGFRWYDPNLQRWLNRDTLGERFERNLYRFNYNAPVNYVDPDGLVGVGIIGGGAVNIGVGGIGAGGNASVGAGVFWGGPAGVNAGAFASGGAFARESPGVVSLKCPSYNQTPWALGAYAGVGAGAFLTNAKTVADLGGPFKQWNLNTPFGSITFGWSEGTWIVGIVSGPGDVGDVSGYPTTTITYPRR